MGRGRRALRGPRGDERRSVRETLNDTLCFVVVHGAYHGAWCWDLVRHELQARGFSTVAVDLPTEDENAGADRYADVVAAAVPAGANRLIVVGHSMGGLTIPLVASRVTVERLVYLCALLPQPGISFDAQPDGMDSGFRPSEAPYENLDGSASWPEQGAIEMYFHDCPTKTATWAARRLRRQHWKVNQEITPLRCWPDVPSTYVAAREDRALAPDYCRRIARDRLRVTPVEIDGGHSPFLARPAELAGLLVATAGSTAP